MVLYPSNAMPCLQPMYMPSYPMPYPMQPFSPMQPFPYPMLPQQLQPLQNTTQPSVALPMAQANVVVSSLVTPMAEYCENIRPLPKQSSAAVMQKPQPVAKPAGTKKNTTERDAPVEVFRQMLVTVLRGGQGGSEVVAQQAGFPRMARSLRNYAAEIRADVRLQQSDPEATLSARIAAAELVEYKDKAPVNVKALRLFSDDDLLFFERTLVKYGDMGWPMDYKAIQRLFSLTAKKMGRGDWRSGDDYVVSESYVRRFVQGSPVLKAFKCSNIDPLRSKKACLTVRSNVWLCTSCVPCIAIEYVCVCRILALSMPIEYIVHQSYCQNLRFKTSNNIYSNLPTVTRCVTTFLI